MIKVEKTFILPEELRSVVNPEAFAATNVAWVGRDDDVLRGCLGLVPLAAISGEWYAWFWMGENPTKDELRAIRTTWREQVLPGRQQIIASGNPACEWLPSWMRWLGMQFYEEAGGEAWYYRKN